MSENIEILRVIQKILEQSDIKARGFKGYGSSQVILDRTPTNLGKSEVSRQLDNADMEKSRDQEIIRKVKVSKAFKRDKK